MIKNKRLSLIHNDSKLPLIGSTGVQSEGTDMLPHHSVAQGALNPTWLASQGHRRDLALTYYYNKIKIDLRDSQLMFTGSNLKYAPLRLGFTISNAFYATINPLITG